MTANPPALPAPSESTMRLGAQLVRVVPLTLPLAVVPWLLFRAEPVAVPLVITVGALIAYTAFVAVVLRALAVPRGGVVAVAVTGAAIYLTLAWVLLVVLSDGGSGAVQAWPPYLVTTVLAAVLATVAIHARSGVPASFAAALAVAPVVVPVVGVLAFSMVQGNDEEDALQAELELTQLPPYLLEIDGYELERVYTDTVDGVADDDPEIRLHIDRRGEDGPAEAALVLTIEPVTSEPCESAPDSCTVEGDVTRGTSLDDYAAIVKDDAVLRVTASSTSEAPDWDGVIAALRDAEVTSYDELADHAD